MFDDEEDDFVSNNKSKPIQQSKMQPIKEEKSLFGDASDDDDFLSKEKNKGNQKKKLGFLNSGSEDEDTFVPTKKPLVS